MQARRIVAAPETRALPFGLLSVALVLPDSDPHTELGVTYESLACGTAQLTTDACITEALEQDEWLADDGKTLVTGDALVVYALHKCRLVGAIATAEADALAKLDNGYGRAVEEGFEAAGLAGADDLTPTPGTPIHPLAGLAMLEAYAAANYGGVPVIHSPRDVTTLLGSTAAVDRYGARLETTQGALVASGGGYGNALIAGVDPGGDTDGVTAGAGERWLRVTGTVVVRRGTAKAIPPTIGAATPKNEFSVFAYQPTVVTHECINAAVLVQSPEAALS